MKNFGTMMKQMKDMQDRMQKMQAELDRMEVEGQAGGGMVKALVNGKGRVARVTIDPSLLTPDEREVVEDLVVAAINDAKAKADAHAEQEISKITGGLKLPGGLNLPF